jgi:hypothetical protein
MTGLVDALFDPFVFNRVIMFLYAVNALQFFMRRYWADGCYWVSAFAITATVTYGYKR